MDITVDIAAYVNPDDSHFSALRITPLDQVMTTVLRTTSSRTEIVINKSEGVLRDITDIHITPPQRRGIISKAAQLPS